MTTIAQYVPRWLRTRLQKPIQPQPKANSKRDRQALPTLPKQERPPIPWQDDSSPAGYRLLWRL
jgi:hypothetical protein